VPIFRRTRNVTDFRFVGGRVFDLGVPVRRIQRVAVGPVPRFQLADLGLRERGPGMRIAGNRVAFFRPRIEKVKVVPPPLRPAARRAVVDVPGLKIARVRAGRALPVPTRARPLAVQTGPARVRNAARLRPAALSRPQVRVQHGRSVQRQRVHSVPPHRAMKMQRPRGPSVRQMHASRSGRMRAAPQRMPRMQRQPGRPGPGRHRP